MLETNKILKTKLSHSDKLYTLTPEDVKNVQADLLEMFLDIKAVCEKEGIPYVFGGGSVLGAVRHQGFIPWDDDIDINVERRYLKPLKEAIEKTYGAKYYVQAPVISPEHYSTFWDVQKCGTTYRESLAQAEGKCGLKVDIFPIENTYSNGFMRGLHRVLSDGASLILSCIRFHDRKKEYLDLAGGEATGIIKVKAAIGAPFSISRKFWLRFANGVFSMYKND
ncbi:MAG: LicD family protein, partial [Lachnospiraceae bacterium]|nr:LicD family protein [Lachnospiraceae bacterium]